MKRTIIISLVIIALILTGTFLFLNKSDYHGRIGTMNKDNFLLAPLKIDLEVQYNSSKLYFDENTKVVGKVNNVENLKEGQEVKVWVTESVEKMVATKIEIISE